MENKREKFWAGGFLYNPAKKEVLLHQRDFNTKFNPGKWAFFGGLNEGMETAKQTFARELKEELNIDIKENDIKLLTEYLNTDLDTWRCVFYVESDLEKSQMKLYEGQDFAWIPINEIFNYDLTEKTKIDLNKFLESYE